MKKREDLFHLIKAMSKSEKRYFTLDAKKSSSKGSKYLVLFQAVNDMEIYDEAKLKKKFGKNLRYDKSYLYEAIMRSMRDYRSANSYAARIKEMTLDAQYLYERSLYQQCGERLEEAKVLASELDDQTSLLEINKAERMLLRQIKGKDYAPVMGGLQESARNAVQALEQELHFLELLDSLVVEVDKKFSLKKEKEITLFKDRYPESIFDDAKSDKSERGRLRLFQARAYYYQLLQNTDGLLRQYLRIVNWWDDNPRIKDEEFHKYIIDISNLLYSYYTKGHYHEFPDILERLEAEKPRNQHDQGVVFQKVMTYKLLYYINTGHTTGIEDVVEAVKKGLDKYQIKAASRNALIFNTSVMLFVLEKFDQSLEWNTMISKGKKYSLRKDIRDGVMLMNLIASYDLDQEDTFESTLRSVQRYFLNRREEGTNQVFAQKLISALRELFFAPLGEINAKMLKLKEYLVSVKENQALKVSLGMDELLLYWVKGKIDKKSIAQQIKEQNDRQSA